jgi:Ran GTPase-activating protein (RanGAP) involved in mRNA processing and transport
MDIESNSLGPDAAKTLCKALGYTNTLESLELRNILIDFNHIVLDSNVLRGEGVALILRSLISPNRTLTTLNLDFNTIGPKGVPIVVNALSQIKRPMALISLGNNELKDKGSSEILKTVVENSVPI